MNKETKDKSSQIERVVINFWAKVGKLTRGFRKHNFEYIGTGECYYQKSKLGKCSKCGIIGFIPKREDFRRLNIYGCNASQKHL